MSNSADFVTGERVPADAGSERPVDQKKGRRTEDPHGNELPPETGSFPVSLWRRLAAIAYDSILLAALFFVVTAVAVARFGAAVDAGTVWLQLLLAATAWLYFTWCWVHGGQTVAMRAWKIRLVPTGTAGRAGQIGWTRATVRFLAGWIPALPLAAIGTGLSARIAFAGAAAAAIAGLAATFPSRHGSCWYDLIAGTRLVRTD